MNNLIHVLKRYRFVIGIAIVLGIFTVFVPDIGRKTIDNTLAQLIQMLFIIPPVFILLGLLDVWVPREIMTKFMGDNSGIKGIVLSFLLGSMAAGPLYGAFPVAAIFMKKGARFSNVLIFLGAWSTTKIPLLMFEYASLGWKFATTRLIVDIFGIYIIARLIDKFISKNEIAKIYAAAESSTEAHGLNSGMKKIK
ncbi:MAG TPA: permease [Clostridiaceae bacterium]|nr:permease [Clostridiaceae bacterium]